LQKIVKVGYVNDVFEGLNKYVDLILSYFGHGKVSASMHVGLLQFLACGKIKLYENCMYTEEILHYFPKF
jgi:hypothetical protein